MAFSQSTSAPKHYKKSKLLSRSSRKCVTLSNFGRGHHSLPKALSHLPNTYYLIWKRNPWQYFPLSLSAEVPTLNILSVAHFLRMLTLENDTPSLLTLKATLVREFFNLTPNFKTPKDTSLPYDLETRTFEADRSEYRSPRYHGSNSVQVPQATNPDHK